MRAPVSWNGRGRPSAVSAIASPSSTSVAGGQGGHRLDHLRHPVGDLLEAAGEHLDLAVVLVHLDPDAVELAVDGHLAPSGPAFAMASADVRGAGGEHRPDRPAGPQRERGQRGGATAERGRGDRQRRPGEHRRPAHRGRRHPGRGGDRLEDQPVERALAQLAGDQAAQVGLLVGGGPREEGAGERGAALLGARPGDPLISSKASCTSATVRRLAAGSGRAARLRQPSPVRRCRSTPERYDVTVSTSSGPASASASASATILAVRERVAATAAEAGTRSARSMPPLWPTPPTYPVAVVSTGPTGLERLWRPAWPCPVRSNLAILRKGAGDPTYRNDPDGTVWRGVRTPEGTATLRLRARPARRGGRAGLGRGGGVAAGERAGDARRR